MKILIGCEFSQVVTKAFRELGHEAFSCDILPTTGNPEWHIQGDVLDYIRDDWELAIFHPPCTYLCSSGLHWNGRIEGRAEETEAALQFVRALLDAPIEKIALENPVGCIATRIRKADQVLQPHYYGADASKATCFWLKNLPRLIPTEYIPPRIVDGKKRWANQTDSGQNKLAPSAERWAKRSVTYPGVAAAIANQWGQ